MKIPSGKEPVQYNTVYTLATQPSRVLEIAYCRSVTDQKRLDSYHEVEP